MSFQDLDEVDVLALSGLFDEWAETYEEWASKPNTTGEYWKGKAAACRECAAKLERILLRGEGVDE